VLRRSSTNSFNCERRSPPDWLSGKPKVY
jgi:hypothetical protein